MDLFLFFTGTIQIFLSLVIGILFIYASFRVFHRRIRKINEIEELKKNNIGVALLNGSVILSIIIMVKSSVEPAISVFSFTFRQPDVGFGGFAEAAVIMLLQIVIAGFIGFVAIFLALQFFMWLTKDINELTEIKNNNIAVSIVLSVVIICVALLLQDGIRTILDSLIPFPPVSFKDIGAIL